MTEMPAAEGWTCEMRGQHVTASGYVLTSVVLAGGSRIFLVALEQFDRDALWPADEADTHPRPNGGWLLGELDSLGPDLGGHGIDVLYGQTEMIEPLIGRHRRGVDAIARGDRRDEHLGAAELDVDPPGATDDLAAENILKPGRGRLRIGTTQVNMIPGDYRHYR